MGVNIQTIKDIRFFLAGELKNNYQEPEISALTNLIIKTVTGISKLHHLYLNNQSVTSEQAEEIIEICKQLQTGKPIQYILGTTSFYDCMIRVNSSTLIPRPETEELVDLIIRENRGYTGDIIDIGTGSGCIAIALAVNLKGSLITGIDISDEAINKARENALVNNVSVLFMQGDIFRFDYKKVNRAGIIVSNPPYVRNSEKQLMSKNVLDFEPHIALFVADTDPLAYYKSILNLSDKILLPGGRIYFEINEVMGRSMIQLLESFRYTCIEIIADINGKERIIKGIKDV
jgi:release factor glutamine methyltransferase